MEPITLNPNLNLSEKDKEFWCECELPSDWVFVDDNVSEVCKKHHYCCADCGKVTQVG